MDCLLPISRTASRKRPVPGEPFEREGWDAVNTIKPKLAGDEAGSCQGAVLRMSEHCHGETTDVKFWT